MPHPIDSIIRQVDSDELPSSKDEKHILLDSKGRILKTAPVLRFGALRHYLVNTHKTAQRTGLLVPLSSLGGTLTLSVAYMVRCEPHCEERLVLSVAGVENPQAAIDGFIGDSIERVGYDFEIEKLVGNFPQFCAVLIERIRVSAKEKLGLCITDLTIVPGNKELDAKTIGPIKLRIRPRDADLVLDVELEGLLGVDALQVARAHLRESDADQLVQGVIRQARDFLQQNVGLHELYTSLSADVTTKFCDSINDLVAQHGRQISALVFRCNFASQELLKHVVGAKEHHVKFEYRNKNHPSPIHIEASLNMRLHDVAKLVRARVTSLDAWVQQTVEQASRDLLFELSHEAFCTRFEHKKAELKDTMHLAARNIGYELEHFYTITDHQIDQLLNGVEIGPIEDSFVVKSAQQLKVRLQVIAEVRVRSEHLDKVMQKVIRNETVQKEIEVSIRSLVVSFLRKITPEDFYVYFEVPRTDDELSQSQQLEIAIRKHLTDTYGAELVSISFTPLETDVISLIERLKRTTQLVALEVQPPKHPVERFELEFRVDGVIADLWYAFQGTMPELSTIAAAVKRHLETELTAFAGELLITRPKDIGHFAGERAVLRVKSDFGLSIRMVTFRRLSNVVDLKVGEEIENARVTEVELQAAARLTAEQQQRILMQASTEQVQALIEKEREYRKQADEARAADDDERAQMLDNIANGAAKEREDIVKRSEQAAQKSHEYAAALTFGNSAFTPQLDVHASRLLLESTVQTRGETPGAEDKQTTKEAGHVAKEA